jgi:hypothetical protein
MMIMRRRQRAHQWQEYEPGVTGAGPAGQAGAPTGIGIAQVPGSTAGGKPSSTRVVAEERGPQGTRVIGEERAPQTPRK